MKSKLPKIFQPSIKKELFIKMKKVLACNLLKKLVIKELLKSLEGWFKVEEENNFLSTFFSLLLKTLLGNKSGIVLSPYSL